MRKLIEVILSIILIISIAPMQGFAMEKDSVHTLSKEQQTVYNIALKSILNIDSSANFNPENISYRDVGDIVNQVVEENPEIFYYNGVTVISDGTIIFKYNDSKKNIIQKKNKIDNAVKKVMNTTIKKKMNDLEKVKAIHDYLVLNVEYDNKNYLNNTVSDDSYQVYGALINKKAVCDGYSKSMQLLLKKAGIQSIYVTGTANGGNHSWNLVKINGKHYHVDTTWDDPAPNKKGVVNYNYFLLTNKQLEKDHYWVESNYPTATSENYNYFHNMNNMIERNGFYYYSNAQNDILYKMNKSSEKISKVVNNVAPYLAISGQWIYYSNYSDGGNLYKVKLTGKEKMKVKNFHVINLYTQSNVLYYTVKSSGKIGRIEL
ncbi:transglutaminase domain-containing protein [Rummeliibacillus sp. NPDC094406]|uniref:transglutaminase domain-containing protein n=1 Tax=Rummeliibacillus sp. NPDC094406 TaxID=3364511 RepID=UPI0037FE5DCF